MHSQQVAYDAAIRTPALRQMHWYAVLASVLGRQLVDEHSWIAQSPPLMASGVARKEHGLHVVVTLFFLCEPNVTRVQ